MTKILIIDRDEVSANLIKSRLSAAGHQVQIETGKAEGAAQAASMGFDIVFMDPAPQTQPRSMVVNLRRQARNYPYMIMTSESLSFQDAIASGFNDMLSKPFDPSLVEEKVTNGQHLLQLLRRLNDDSEDFKSAGGIIAKSAFNQLFLSGIDRADRYGERSYVMFIALKNYPKLKMEMDYEADVAAAKLGQHLVRLRRQSDIIGQTGVGEYALLLQRPQFDHEPIEASNRFAEALSKCGDILTSPLLDAEILIQLIDLPSGGKIIEHNLVLQS